MYYQDVRKLKYRIDNKFCCCLTEERIGNFYRNEYYQCSNFYNCDQFSVKISFNQKIILRKSHIMLFEESEF